MANLPASWAANSRYLNDFVTPVLPLDNPIPMNECVDSQSSRQIRLSQLTNSAATMDFYVNTEDIINYSDSPGMVGVGRQYVLLRSLLGGWDEVTGTKVVPMRHPYIRGLYCKDIVGITDWSPQGPSNTDKIQPYSVSRLTLSFESLPYYVNKVYDPTEANGINPNWIEVGTRGTSNRVSTPIGFYVFQSGFPPYFPAQSGNWMVQPQNFLTVIFHHVTESQLFTTADSLKLRSGDFIGMVNQNPLLGYAAETLLLDSIEAMPWTDWFGERRFEVKVNLVYNAWTWNKQPDLGGTLTRIGFVLGGAPPFQSFLMSANLFNLLNPRS